MDEGHDSAYLPDGETGRSETGLNDAYKGAATPLTLGVGSLSSPICPKQFKTKRRNEKEIIRS